MYQAGLEFTNPKHTDIRTHIATYRFNQPRGRFNENSGYFINYNFKKFIASYLENKL